MSNEPADETSNVIELTTEIISAFVRRNEIAANDIPALIKTVHATLTEIATGNTVATVAEPQKPAVPIRKSITPDYIISLEDGRQFKSMKRYLSIKGMTPEQYRTKWGLPSDYPMVAPNYAAARSALAVASGLGQGGRKPAKAGPKRAPRK